MEGALADEGWKVKGNKEGLWNHWEQDGSGHSGIYKNDLREGVWHFGMQMVTHNLTEFINKEMKFHNWHFPKYNG